MNVRPLQDRLVVRRHDAKTAEGSIIIPEVAKERPIEGDVIATGVGKHVDGILVPLGMKVGDRVMFGRHAGTEIHIDGVEFLVLREDEVLGVIEAL